MTQPDNTIDDQQGASATPDKTKQPSVSKSLPFGVYTIDGGSVVVSVKRGKFGERITTTIEKWPYYDTEATDLAKKDEAAR